MSEGESPSEPSRAPTRKRGSGKKRKKPRPAIRDQKPHRVRHCMRLMSQGLWISGLTAEELANKWGVTMRSMESYAAEASRRIREGIMLDDELRGQVLSTIQSIQAEAHEIEQLALMASKPVPAIGDEPAHPAWPKSISESANAASMALRVKLDAVKAFAEISGAKAVTKIEVSNNLGELLAAAATQEAREKLERPGNGSPPAPSLEE
jgi:hypothetical protein